MEILIRMQVQFIVTRQAWPGPKADGFDLAYSGFGLNVAEARPEAGGKPKTLGSIASTSASELLPSDWLCVKRWPCRIGTRVP